MDEKSLTAPPPPPPFRFVYHPLDHCAAYNPFVLGKGVANVFSDPVFQKKYLEGKASAIVRFLPLLLASLLIFSSPPPFFCRILAAKT